MFYKIRPGSPTYRLIFKTGDKKKKKYDLFFKNGQDQFWLNDIEQNDTQQNDTVKNHTNLNNDIGHISIYTSLRN